MLCLKPVSYFSILRIKVNKNQCVDCGKCKKVCPMNVDITDSSRKRINGTECIVCMKCVSECLKKAIKWKIIRRAISKSYYLG